MNKYPEKKIHPHAISPCPESGYRQMAEDKKREEEAAEWAEAVLKDIFDSSIKKRGCYAR